MEILSPLIGHNLAKSSVQLHCKKNATTPETLSPAKLPEVAAGIGKALCFFIGKDMAQKVSEELVRAGQR